MDKTIARCARAVKERGFKVGPKLVMWQKRTKNMSWKPACGSVEKIEICFSTCRFIALNINETVTIVRVRSIDPIPEKEIKPTHNIKM